MKILVCLIINLNPQTQRYLNKMEISLIGGSWICFISRFRVWHIHNQYSLSRLASYLWTDTTIICGKCETRLPSENLKWASNNQIKSSS